MQVIARVLVLAAAASVAGLASAATSRASKVIRPAMSLVAVSAGLRGKS